MDRARRCNLEDSNLAAMAVDYFALCDSEASSDDGNDVGNCVISYLHLYMTQCGLKKETHLHADNCVGFMSEFEWSGVLKKVENEGCAGSSLSKLLILACMGMRENSSTRFSKFAGSLILMRSLYHGMPVLSMYGQVLRRTGLSGTVFLQQLQSVFFASELRTLLARIRDYEEGKCHAILYLFFPFAKVLDSGCLLELGSKQMPKLTYLVKALKDGPLMMSDGVTNVYALVAVCR